MQSLRDSNPGAFDPATYRGVDVVRGSTNIPLSPAGEQQASEMGQAIRRCGGVDQIFASSLIRTIDTAKRVRDANPKSRIQEITGSLHPWHLGGLEGQPTKEVLPKMNHYILNRPDYIPAGKGPKSTEPGESFNHFRIRLLNYMKSACNRWSADQKQRFLIVTHYRDIKAIQAWIAAGCPDDLSIDSNEMLRKDGEPGDIHYLTTAPHKLQNITKRVAHGSFDMKGGVYVLRHGFTAMNGENPTDGSAKSYKLGANDHAVLDA